MTYEEYLDTQTQMLEDVPPEFHSALSALSFMAYDCGHTYGYGEVLIHLQELLDALSAPLVEFAKRIKQETLLNITVRDI